MRSQMRKISIAITCMGGEGSDGNMWYCTNNLFYIFDHANYILIKD